jgi:CubicO group peptidase (beta-lactamase class C family)
VYSERSPMLPSGIHGEIQSLAEKTQHRTGIPGVNIAVSVGGERAVASVGTPAAGSGIPMSIDARFTIGCITKLLTSMVVLELAQTGKLCLEESLSEYLPDLRCPSRKLKISIRHLGSHTSGYAGLNPARVEYGYFYSWDKFTEFFRETPQIFTPGAVFNYEHTEGVLLGEVVRSITGRSAQSLIREIILDPLALNVGSSLRDAREPPFRIADHSFDPHRSQYQVIRSVPFCDFWSASLADMTISVWDLLTFGEALVETRPASGISLHALRKVREQVVDLPQTTGAKTSEALPRSFGFGCGEYGPSLFGHNGSGRGQTCGFRFDPKEKIVVAVALNAWEPYARDSLVDKTLGILDASRPRSDASSHTIQPSDPSDIEGVYAGCAQGLAMIVAAKGDSFVCTIKGVGPTGKGELGVVLGRNEEGRLVMRSADAQHLSVGLFREAGTGTPCFMLGLNVFKKLQEASCGQPRTSVAASSTRG